MTRPDYLIVGSGVTGATIARVLADHGREVLVIERRNHLGGNVHDFLHSSQIRIHTYGPHYFRCSSRRIWDFVNRFSTFIPYSASVKTFVAGQYEDWPINRKLFDSDPDWQEGLSTSRAANFEQACLQKMPRSIYDAFVLGYTRRQWGIDPRKLDARLAERITINGHGETSLTPRHRVQGLPQHGYAHFMESLLARIPHLLNVDFLQSRSEYHARKTIVFTGPIDEYFGFSGGRLAYRGQRRVNEFIPHLEHYQPCAQVNFPQANDDEPIRSIEWKYLMPQPQRPLGKGTVITNEYPFTPNDPNDFEYPLLAPEYRRHYEFYRRRAAQIPGLIVCGRLGEYRYLDMDHAIGRALLLAKKLIDA